ncbi:alkaline phosphatase [Xanthomonas bromi]|uniref:Alkaline phosphatase n=1 Tax=Xanthomonas bromi TaxID=56449 RepID=A0A1C3NIS3_9XANT|nr:alkaline phosphatase D family protein [Xanthomonas bromi]PPV08060.1 alkaline phosphatase [Xanthomonas bromi]SBV50247.1 alkaline phosphatase [Xanthomonas bromi]
MTASDPARRRLLQGLGAGLLLPAAASWPARSLAAPSGRPTVTDGVQSGDVLDGRAMLWSRTDRPARMRVEWDTRPSLRQARRVDGPMALPAHDVTARIDLGGLPRDQDIFYRVRFEDAGSGVLSASVHGHLRSAPATRRDVRFVWSGDTVGQGFGINPDIGGMRIYSAMRERNPDFFLHSGDTIYADSPIPAELTVEEGKRWRNLTTTAKNKVAETLDEFRGNYRYNLLDDHVRRFNARVPQLWQWDDHETTNNWSPGKQLDARYQGRDIEVLATRARQAFLEYAPMRGVRADGNGHIYRKIAYGPLLDVFVLDMRSDRGANSDNLQPQAGPDAAFLGPEQLAWLQRELAGARAQWKVIAADMPIGLQVPDGEDASGRPRWEAIANGDPGVPRGREQEIAALLRFISRARIRNTVWLTADVHYCAAHHYHPDRAAFQQFEPFWEFVGGPLNAGSFGPNALDATFGPSVVFQKAPPAPNTSPLAGYQFFGEVEIDGRSGVMTVTLRDLDGVAQFRQPILPHGVA